MKSLVHNQELKRNTHKPFICIMATHDCYLTKTISFLPRSRWAKTLKWMVAKIWLLLNLRPFFND